MNTNEHEIGNLIQQGESLVMEFKSDLKCLPNRELVSAVVALANTDGGDLLLGVEDDGLATGLHANHLNVSGIPSHFWSICSWLMWPPTENFSGWWSNNTTGLANRSSTP